MNVTYAGARPQPAKL